MRAALKELIAIWGEYADLTRASAVLEWDQETMLPPGGTPARGTHLATLAGIAHEKLVSPSFLSALTAAEKLDGTSVHERAMLREARRAYDHAVKIPAELVREIAKAQSVGLVAWKKARRTDRWREFAAQLATIVRLKKRVAECVGYQDTPYDALIDEFEPGATVKELDPLLLELREATIPLVRKLRTSRRRPNRRLVTGHFPKEQQLRFARRTIEGFGFDFERGRIDLSAHPFCTSFDTGDVRLTVRIFENDLRPALFGLMHEAGHGLYEQGIDPKLMRTPVGESTSLGIHESQSRLWENQVGRSRAYWKSRLPALRRAFPEALKGARLDDFYFAINEVRPSLIRVEADEVTYNLHIVLRYEIEKGLFSEKIRTSDLPEIWNRKMKELLGIVPPTDADGVLQDIHWAMGLFGYFPTYSLGNLYAAQIFARMRRMLPDLDGRLERGDLEALKEWLRKNIHKPGRTYTAKELIRRATKRDPSPAPFISYVTEKFGELYGL